LDDSVALGDVVEPYIFIDLGVPEFTARASRAIPRRPVLTVGGCSECDQRENAVGDDNAVDAVVVREGDPCQVTVASDDS
jgi:hypothetical protein